MVCVGALNLECQLNVETSESGGRKVSNTRTLSGGEKSFTTLSLLLALGAVTSVPFAIFDEIDVYMDDGAAALNPTRRRSRPLIQ